MQPTRPLTLRQKTIISEVLADLISSNIKVAPGHPRRNEGFHPTNECSVGAGDGQEGGRPYPALSVNYTQTPPWSHPGKAWQEECCTISLDTVSPSFRKAWSEEDVILEERFKNASKCPIKAALKSIMEELQELKDLVERNEFNRVHKKVKNHFKKRKIWF